MLGLIRAEEKICTKCKSPKPLIDAYRCRVAKNGTAIWNKRCNTCLDILYQHLKPETTRQRRARYYLTHKEQKLVYGRTQQREYRQTHAGQIKEYKRRNAIPLRIKEYRKNARLKNRVIELSDEEFTTLFQSPCFYCGDCSVLNGVDRKDSSLGYTRNNVLPCCKACNVAKNKTPFSEFCAWIAKAAAHLQNKGTQDV